MIHLWGMSWPFWFQLIIMFEEQDLNQNPTTKEVPEPEGTLSYTDLRRYLSATSRKKGLNVSLLFTRLGWKNEREAEKQMSARMSLCSEHSLTAASVPEYVGESNSTLSPGFTSISNTCQNKRRNTSLDRTPWGPTQWLRDWTPYSAGQFKSPPISRK